MRLVNPGEHYYKVCLDPHFPQFDVTPRFMLATRIAEYNIKTPEQWLFQVDAHPHVAKLQGIVPQ